MKFRELILWLCALLVLTGGIPTLANTPTRTLVTIEEGTPGDPDSDHLLLYSDGSVEFLKNRETGKLARLKANLAFPGPDLILPRDAGDTKYEPSIIPLDRAKEIFSTMSLRVRRTSQCYNRALIWGYEAWKNQGLKSMKVFMFFTRKYIRDYHYKWWFHSSPLAIVENGDGTEERVLDRYFMREPVSLKTWSDYFIKPKTPCATAALYSDYRDHQDEHYCYFMKVPMYYWQPKDVEARDAGKPHPEEFVASEVEYAYQQAFKKSP